MFDLGSLMPFISLAISSVAPYVTEVVKNGLDAVGVRIPKLVKGVVNVAVSAVVAGVAGSVFGAAGPTALLGAGSGLASAAGFKVGKRS